MKMYDDLCRVLTGLEMSAKEGMDEEERKSVDAAAARVLQKDPFDKTAREWQALREEQDAQDA
jgi:hypothetical protein